MNVAMVTTSARSSRNAFDSARNIHNQPIRKAAKDANPKCIFWNGSAFVEPENPPAFRLRFPGRGRGVPDTGGLSITEVEGGHVVFPMEAGAESISTPR